MSFLNYLKSRDFFMPPLINLEEYKESLSNHIFSLQESGDLWKYSINYRDLEKKLYEINYPNVDKFLINLKSNNIKKIKNIYKEFTEWNQKESILEIENCFHKIKSFLYLEQDLGINDANLIIENKLKDAEFELQYLFKKVESCLEELKWSNNSVILMPIFEPNEDLIPTQFKIISENCQFICHKLKNKFTLSKVVCKENFDPSIMNALNLKLASKLRPKYIELYFQEDKNKRSQFESIKKELACGYNVKFPLHVEFFKNIPKVNENQDIWKIKLDENQIVQYLNKYETLNNQLDIKWLELINEK